MDLERDRALAARLARRPAGGIAIRGARLFDPETGKSRPGTTVVIAGDRIRAVGPDGKVRIPAGAEVVDARGKTLLPGLWDMHQHLTPTDGLLDIAAGVTTARDMGNDLDSLLELRRRWDSAEAIGPRVLMACVIDGPGPYAAPTKVLATTEAEALAARGPLRRRRLRPDQDLQLPRSEAGAGRRGPGPLAGPAHLGAHPLRHERRAGRARGFRRDPARQLPLPELHPGSGHPHARRA